MKIKADVEHTQDAVRISTKRGISEALTQPNKSVNKESKSETDTVNIALGQALNSELNLTQIAAERREKIERLKKAIQDGTYNPSSDLVAKAVGEEIVLEILSAEK